MAPPLKRKQGLAFVLGLRGSWVGDGGMGLYGCGGFGCPSDGLCPPEGFAVGFVFC